jgi:DNA-binding transcriptional LysR family regulator
MEPIEPVDLNDYRYFAAVVDAGGFSAAERLLGVPKSRLSRRVAALERRLGVRLLQRSTRRITLTDTGRQVVEHARAIVREAEAADCVATAVRVEPSGTLRVSLPPQLLESGQLAEIFTAFLVDNPRVMLELVVTPRRVDPVAEGIDLAIRVRSRADEDPQWAIRRLQRARGILVASPGLVADHGGLATPDSLREVPALGSPDPDRKVHWPLESADGDRIEVAAPVRLACDNFALRLRAAMAGLGVTMLPDDYVAPFIAEGRLVRVLPDWDMPSGTLQAVYPTQRGLPVAVRALLDAMVAAYRPGPEVDA